MCIAIELFIYYDSQVSRVRLRFNGLAENVHSRSRPRIALITTKSSHLTEIYGDCFLRTESQPVQLCPLAFLSSVMFVCNQQT